MDKSPNSRRRGASLLGVSVVVAASLVYGATGAAAATDLGTQWAPDGITEMVCNVNAEGIGNAINTPLTLHMACNLQGNSIVWANSGATVYVKPIAGNHVFQYHDTVLDQYGTVSWSTSVTGNTCTQLTYAGRWQATWDVTGQNGGAPGDKVWSAPTGSQTSSGSFTTLAGTATRMNFGYYSNSGCTTLISTSPAQPIASNSNAGTALYYIGASSSTPAYPNRYFTGGSSGSGPQACFTISPTTPQGAPTTITASAACTVGIATSQTASYEWTVTGGAYSDEDLSGTTASATLEDEANYSITLTITVGGTDYVASQSYNLQTDAGADDDDCPTGWGLLNPFSVGSLARCLFIPSGDAFDDLQAAYDGSIVETVTEPMGNIVDWWAEFESHATGDPPGNPGGDPCEGPVLHVPTGNVNDPGHTTTEIKPLEACSGDTAYTFRVLTRALTGFGFYFLFVWYAIRTVSGWLE